MKAKITAALVKAPPPIPVGARKLRISDTDLPGLTMEVWPSGNITFWLRYSDHGGRSREIKLGKACHITVDQARRKAKELRAQICLDGDPAAARDKLRAVPSFSTFVLETYLPYAKERIKSYRDHASFCRLRLLPTFGSKRLDEIKTTDIVELQRRIKEDNLSNATCNRYVALMKRIFNLARRWEAYEGRNPAQNVELFREQGRERFLTPAEVQRLFQVLDAEHNQSAASCIAVMGLTGCRKGEALNARFEDIDLERRTWRVPRSKSGKVRHIPLSDAAVRLLVGLRPKPDCPWLFPNEAGTGPIENIRRTWQRVKVAASLPPGVRPHDLRHTFASLVVGAGRSLYEVTAILGHASPGMSQKYAHLANETLVEAADIVGRIATLPPSKSAEE